MLHHIMTMDVVIYDINSLNCNAHCVSVVLFRLHYITNLLYIVLFLTLTLQHICYCHFVQSVAYLPI